MFAAGLLRPPAEPTLIWNFVAARRDHFPAEDVRNFQAPPDRLIGYYLNFQFTSTGSHLAAAEGPWKMAANYRIVDGTGAAPLAFTVVNAGNIREHLAELSANADMMWRFREFSAEAFLRRFCTRYFGAGVADEAARLYRDFFDDNVRARAQLMVQINSLLHETTLAYRAHGLHETQRRHLEAARGFIDAMQETLAGTRHGPFTPWYENDRTFGLAALRIKLEQEISRRQ